MKRNYSVDALKLLFAIGIALGHYGVGNGSGIIVNCFFIMSGFYLVQSFNSGKYADGFYYLKARINRIYPYYFIALIILIAALSFQALINGEGISYLYSTVTSVLPELMFMQNVGIFKGTINYPLWQMSTLLVASYILFSLMCINKTLTTNVLSPLIAIIGGSYFSNAYKTHDPTMWWLIGSSISAPLLRAFTGLCIGIAFYEFIKCSLDYLEKRSGIITTIASALAILYFGINFYSGNTFQSMLSFVLVFITLLCSKGILTFILNRKIFKHFEKLSLSIYVNHALIINVVNFLTKNRVSDSVATFFYIILLLVYSIIFMKVADYLIIKFIK